MFHLYMNPYGRQLPTYITQNKINNTFQPPPIKKETVVHDSRPESEKKEQQKPEPNKTKRRRKRGDYVEFKI